MGVHRCSVRITRSGPWRVYGRQVRGVLCGVRALGVGGCTACARVGRRVWAFTAPRRTAIPVSPVSLVSPGLVGWTQGRVLGVRLAVGFCHRSRAGAVSPGPVAERGASKVTVPQHKMKTRSCRTCRGRFPMGALINGDCPSCVGQAPLPLRGEGGRFVTFNTRTGGGR